MSDAGEKKLLTRLGSMLIEHDQQKKREKALRLTRRQGAEVFNEDAGKAMFSGISGRAKPAFEGNEIVPVADVWGNWSDPLAVPVAATKAATLAAEDVACFILGRGPQNPKAIARRAATAAMILGIISTARAAHIAGCSERTIQRLAKNVGA